MTEKKKKGRPTAVDKDPLIVPKLIRAYRHYKSVRRVCYIFGLHHTTVTKYLTQAGIDVTPGVSRYSYNNQQSAKNKMIKFAKENNVVLPRCYKSIALLTGMKRDAIYTTFFRMRKRIKQVMDDIPDLKKLPKPGVKCRGVYKSDPPKTTTIFLNDDIETYNYKVDSYAQFVLLTVKYKNIDIPFEVYIENNLIFSEEVCKYYFNNLRE